MCQISICQCKNCQMKFVERHFVKKKMFLTILTPKQQNVEKKTAFGRESLSAPFGRKPLLVRPFSTVCHCTSLD